VAGEGAVVALEGSASYGVTARGRSEESLRDSNRIFLEELQCKLLRQHDVAHGRQRSRLEAEQTRPSSRSVELLDIQLAGVVNAVSNCSLGAHGVEVAVRLVLLALCG
jgi:hypothetical protein